MPLVSVHPDATQLQEFLAGKVSAAEAAGIECHLNSCPECLHLLSAVREDPLLQLPRESMSATSAPPANAWAPQPLLPAEVNSQEVTRPYPGEQTGSWFSPSVMTRTIPPELAQHPRYDVLRVLGQGGMGAVYLAQHRRMERLVAIKVIRPGLLSTATALPRFQREVKAAARLSHPNIVQAYDADQAGALHFLVMEYIEGTDLARMLREHQSLPMPLACDLVRQAALGLQHAHEQGMIHRDIKPHNLMVTPNGEVKILDFGLAGFARETDQHSPSGHLTESGVVMGTADYIAPEQTRDAGRVDIRADIYSLGCTLYQLLAGRVPFQEGSVVDKMLRHSLDAPDPLNRLRPDLPVELVAVVEKMMAKKPEARFATPAEVAGSLQPFSREALSPVRVESPNPTSKPEPRKVRRIPWGIYAALLALLGAGLLAAVVYRIQTDQGEVLITAESPDVEVTFLQGGKAVRIVDTKTNKTLTLPTGEYNVAVNKPDEFAVRTNTVTIRRGKETLVTIDRRPKVVGGGEQPGKVEVLPAPLHRVKLTSLSKIPLPPDDSQVVPLLSPDGRYVGATANRKHGPVPSKLLVYDAATGKERQEFVSPGGFFTAFCFLSEDRVLTSTISRPGGFEFRLWDITTGKGRLLEGWPEVNLWPSTLQVSPDGKVCLVNLNSTQVLGIEFATGQQLFRLEPSRPGTPTYTMAGFTPDGQCFATREQLSAPGTPLRYRLEWREVGNGNLRTSYELEGWVSAQIGFVEGGKTLALARQLKEMGYLAEFLERASGKSLRVQHFVAYEGFNYMTVFPNGRFAVFKNQEQLIRVHDLTNGKTVSQETPLGGVGGLFISADSSRLLSVGKEQARVYAISGTSDAP